MSRRRRKRRHGHGRAARVWAMASVVVLVLLVVGLVGGYFWLTHFLRSEAFRARVNEKASGLTGAEVAVERLDWDGMLVRIPRVQAAGEGLIRSGEMEGVEAEVDLGRLLRREIRTTPVHVRRAHVSLDVTRPAPPLPKQRGAFEFPGVAVEDLSGTLGFGGPALSWEGWRGGVYPGQARGSYDCEFSGGRLSTPIAMFPHGELETLKARYFGGFLFLTESRFAVYESGWLELTGEVEFSRGRYSLEGKLGDIYGKEMVPEDWKKRLEGTLQSDFRVRGEGRERPVVSGDLELIDGVLTGLPILDRVSAYTDTIRFRRLVLSEAHLDFSQQGDRLELRNIVVASEGLLRLEGQLDLVGRRIDGRFSLGLTPGTLARIPGAETKVFRPGKEGLLWAPVVVHGTLDDPEEDLSGRLIAAAGERMFELIPETGQYILRHSNRAASELARGVLEQGQEAAEAGTGLIGEGGAILQGGARQVREGVGSVLGRLPLLGTGRSAEPEVVVPEEDLPEEDE